MAKIGAKGCTILSYRTLIKIEVDAYIDIMRGYVDGCLIQKMKYIFIFFLSKAPISLFIPRGICLFTFKKYPCFGQLYDSQFNLMADTLI